MTSSLPGEGHPVLPPSLQLVQLGTDGALTPPALGHPAGTAQHGSLSLGVKQLRRKSRRVKWEGGNVIQAVSPPPEEIPLDSWLGKSLWLFGTTVTQRCHPTAERALGDGTVPGASTAHCSLAMEDVERQQDSRDDTQVTKMLPGLSKRESWNFSPARISLFLSRSQQHGLKDSAPAGTGLTYFTLSDLTLLCSLVPREWGRLPNTAQPPDGTASTILHVLPCQRGQLAAIPSFSP